MSESHSPKVLAELDRQRAQLRNRWRIADECGLPETEAQKTFFLIFTEMKILCGDFPRALQVAEFARQWIATGNPFCLDAAATLCGESLQDLPPSLAPLLADLHRLRWIGETRGGTAEHLRKDMARDLALNFMVSLCVAGATVDQAASKAARMLVDRNMHRFKASTLSKNYTSAWRKRERDLLIALGSECDIHVSTWQRIMPFLPEADDQLKGERR